MLLTVLLSGAAWAAQAGPNSSTDASTTSSSTVASSTTSTTVASAPNGAPASSNSNGLPTTTTKPIATTTTSISPGPIFKVSRGYEVVAIIGLIILVVGVWLGPYLFDLSKSYSQVVGAYGRALNSMLRIDEKPNRKPNRKPNEAVGDSTDNTPPSGAVILTQPELDQIKDLLDRIHQGPVGTPGLVRVLFPFTVITIIGIALVLLLASGASDAGNLRSTIIAGLLTTFATIVGFYFGGKSSTDAIEATQKATPAALVTQPATTAGVVTLVPTHWKVPADTPSQVFTLRNRSGTTVHVTKLTFEPDIGCRHATGDQSAWIGGQQVDLADGGELHFTVEWDPASDSAKKAIEAKEKGVASSTVSLSSTMSVTHTGSGLPPTAVIEVEVPGSAAIRREPPHGPLGV